MRRIFAVLMALVLLATACSSSGTSSPEVSAPDSETSQNSENTSTEERPAAGDKLPAAEVSFGSAPEELAYSNWTISSGTSFDDSYTGSEFDYSWDTGLEEVAYSEPASNATDAEWIKVYSLTGGLHSGDYAGAAEFSTGEVADTYCLEYNDSTPHFDADGNLHRISGAGDLSVSLTNGQVDTLEKIMDAYNDADYWNGSSYSPDLYDGIASAVWSVTDGHGLSNAVAQDIMAKVQDGTYTNNTSSLYWARSDNSGIQDQMVIVPPGNGPESAPPEIAFVEETSACQVQLFDFPFGDGLLTTLGVGEYNLQGDLAWLNDDIESIFVPEGMTIEVSEGFNGSGWTKSRVGPGTFEVHNDQVSWIKIAGSCNPATAPTPTPAPVTPAPTGDCQIDLFDFPNGQVQLSSLGAGEYNLEGDLAWLNDDIESIYVPAGMKITVSEDFNGGGWTKFREGPGTFEVNNDQVSWIKVEGSCQPPSSEPKPGSIGDRVWLDDDGDGNQENGEPGIPGVSMTLTDDDGEEVATTTTDESGMYSFDDVVPGTYTITVEPPAGHTQTYDLDGNLDNSSTETLGELENARIHDFGFVRDSANGNTGAGSVNGLTVPKATCASTSWQWENTIDLDRLEGNAGIPVADLRLKSFGTRQESVNLPNIFVPGVEITITEAVAWDGYRARPDTGDQPNERYRLVFRNNGTVVHTTPWTGTTSSDGIATGVASAQWQGPLGSAVLPDGADEMVFVHWSDIELGEGDVSNTNSVVPTSVCIEITAPANPGSIGDWVWHDADRDGAQDSSENGIANVTVQLLDGNTIIGQTTTDTNGGYLFDELDAGTYTVRVDPATVPAGYTQTADLDGSLDHQSVEVLDQGEDNLRHDFGYAAPPVELASIGDYVWLDENRDGIQDASEPGIAGVSVRLYDENTVRLATVETDANGNYLFDDLTPGDYSVSVDALTLPDGYEQTWDLDEILDDSSYETLSAGEDNRDHDFGYAAPVPPASIGDYVWLDADRDLRHCPQMLCRPSMLTARSTTRPTSALTPVKMTGHRTSATRRCRPPRSATTCGSTMTAMASRTHLNPASPASP